MTGRASRGSLPEQMEEEYQWQTSKPRFTWRMDVEMEMVVFDAINTSSFLLHCIDTVDWVTGRGIPVKNVLASQVRQFQLCDALLDPG